MQEECTGEGLVRRLQLIATQKQSRTERGWRDSLEAHYSSPGTDSKDCASPALDSNSGGTTNSGGGSIATRNSGTLK